MRELLCSASLQKFSLKPNACSWTKTGVSADGITYTNESVIQFIEGLRVFADMVTDLPQVTVVDRDPQDDMVIATALKAHASYLVTRDDDLLSLTKHAEMVMVTPERFMAILREMGRVRIGISNALFLCLKRLPQR